MAMHLKRRSSHGGLTLSTSLWGLTLSVVALVGTLLCTSIKVPCHVRLPGSVHMRLEMAGGAAPAAVAQGAGAATAAAHERAAAAPRALEAAPTAAPPAPDPLPPPARPPPRTLSFDVCNGFANQRLALIYGLVIAKQLGRAAVLPPLILDGTQMTDANTLAGAGGVGAGAFEDFYDPGVLRGALAKFGVTALTRREWDAAVDAEEEAEETSEEQQGAVGGGSSSSRSSRSSSSNTFSRASSRRASSGRGFYSSGGGNVTTLVLEGARPIEDIPWHFAPTRAASHLVLDCPLFRLGPGVVLREKKFIWAVLAALRPAAAVEARVVAATAQLGGGPFNFLHLRLERDWQAHCERWAALSAADGVVRDNCFNNTLTVATAMQSMRLDPALPVYVAAHWAGADPQLAASVLSGIAKAGYTVVRAPSGSAPGSLDGMPRELRALVEFEVALRANRFLGNSVSTFSALAILQRRASGGWAGYYNGGDIPLASVVPLFDTPWAFTFNSWSAGYEPMLKAAVRSALRTGGLTPHCIFAGDTNAPIVSWLGARGVRVIPHDPAWRADLVARVRGKASANLAQSHLFASEDSVVGTWQRIDLPIIPWLDQYTYVLFTDADVLFRRPFSFQEFPRPLPRAVGMGPEMADMFPYNAGIMLAHLPVLRETYRAFLDFILANDKGLTFPGFGPGDQGAYNQFYEKDVRAWRLPSKFNAKPYHASDPQRLSDVAIVHFHGPKPGDYLGYAETGACPRFGGMCRAGMAARACVFLHEWVRRLEGEEGKTAHARWLAACAGGGGGGGRSRPVTAAA